MHDCLSIQILSPPLHRFLRAGEEVFLHVQVTLACGCPAGAGGRFDARRFRVAAVLWSERGGLKRAPLQFAGGPATFEGRIGPLDPGRTPLEIEAFDPETGAAGRRRVILDCR